MSTIKKLLLVALACIVVMALAACGKNNTNDSKKDPTATPTQPAAQPGDPTATPTPDVPARDLKGLEVIISDWWSKADFNVPKNEADEKFWEWHNAQMTKYNYKIIRHGDGKTSTGEEAPEFASGYGWGDQSEKNLLAITDGKPLGSIVTFDYRFIGALMDSEEMLFCDVSKLEEFNFNDKKWNKSVIDLMTINGGIYGWNIGKEPRTGIFFNKDKMNEILGDGGADIPYQLQAKGEWTWDNFKDLAKKLTTQNADGTYKTYGFASQQSVFFEMAWVSNGHALISRDDSTSRFTSNAVSSDIINDMNWAYSFYTENIMRRQNEEEAAAGQWNYFEFMFQNQEAVMLAYDEYKASEFSAVNNGVRAYDFDFGFVCFPKGPNAKDYITVARENILVIPVSEDNKKNLADIAFAYNIFTNPTPDDSDDPNSWKLQYENIFRDSKAVDETLDIMINKSNPVTDKSYIIPGLWDNSTGVVQSALLYNIDSPDKQPAQLLEEVNSRIQECINDYHAKRLK